MISRNYVNSRRLMSWLRIILKILRRINWRRRMCRPLSKTCISMLMKTKFKMIRKNCLYSKMELNHKICNQQIINRIKILKSIKERYKFRQRIRNGMNNKLKKLSKIINTKITQTITLEFKQWQKTRNGMTSKLLML